MAPTPSAPPLAPEIAGLPAGHPPVEPGQTMPAPPLTEEQLAQGNATSHGSHGNYDLEYDDPALRSQIAATDEYNSLVQIGNQEFDAGHPRLAILAYEKALKLNPNDPNVQTDLGVMYRAMHRHDEAREAFRQAARLDPRHVQSRYNLGLVLLEDDNDVPGAIQAWEDYLEIAPEGEQAEYVRGRLKEIKAS